ncbi:MAG: Holliday junction resolvase RecU [Sulfobacillus thermotolerans]|nr:Holliday junction resolvase RecU [Sulfobacillus thermotolerans]
MKPSGRGMALEALINHASAVYRERGWCVVYKRPTPVKILRTRGTRILSAVLESASTVDYEGVYRGHSLQFEAKSTAENRFDLKNILPHQVAHLRECRAQGALCFLLLEFSAQGRVYLVPAERIFSALDDAENGGRKSIRNADIESTCYAVTQGRGVVLDYLAALDAWLAAEPQQAAQVEAARKNG